MIRSDVAGRKNLGALVWLGLAIALAAAANLWFGRGLSFFGDDWSYLLYRRPWTLSVFLAPHNEHASLLPVLVYKVIALSGTSAYWPYLLAAQVGIAGAAIAIYVLMRRHLGDVPALLAAVCLLVFGAGADDYLWAFQLASTWAAALGLWTLVLIDREPVDVKRGALAAAVLTMCLFTAGVGLFYWVACAVRLSTARRRATLLVLVPSAVLYAAWYLVFGRGHTHPSLAIGADLAYLFSGLGAAGGAQLLGLPVSGLPMVIALMLLVGWGLWKYRQPMWWALAAGLLAQFILIAFVRSDLGAAEATASRYLWVSGTFTAPFWAALIAAAWRERWPRVAAVVLLLVFVLGGAVSYRRTVNYRYHLLQVQARHPARYGAPADLRP